MNNAKGGEHLDFKINDMPDGLTPQERGRYTYIGMSFNRRVASTKDVRYYSAGYVAGKHGCGWGSGFFTFSI